MMNELWTDFRFYYFWNDLKRYDLFLQITNSMKKKLKLINEIWILITWWTINTCMTHEYNWFWSWSKSVNDSIRRSYWLNIKYKIIKHNISSLSYWESTSLWVWLNKSASRTHSRSESKCTSISIIMNHFFKLLNICSHVIFYRNFMIFFIKFIRNYIIFEKYLINY